MSDATRTQGYSPNALRMTLQASMAAYKLFQAADGRAAALLQDTAGASGNQIIATSAGVVTVTKTTGISLLDGGRGYWDYSANSLTFQKVNDRDFYAGRIVGDAASSDATCTLNLNANPPYDLDQARDPYTTAPSGTQALGGFLPPQINGGSITFQLTATNEVQKVDALGKDGFAAGGACAVVEAAFNVISLGAGNAPDFNIGIASATHATDADSIAQHLFCHIDGNSGVISFQSKDGTNTTAATNSTKTVTAGAGNANRVEVWFDLRSAASVKLYVNGVQVLSGTTFNVSAAALTWLLLTHLEKTISANTFQVDVEWLRARFAQQRG